jgi:hypothetical protein
MRPLKHLVILAFAACFGIAPAKAGFRSPESLIRNVYAYYGAGIAELSKGLPRDPETARQFFDPGLRNAWTAPRDAPYDFLVQSPTWNWARFRPRSCASNSTKPMSPSVLTTMAGPSP